MSEKMKLCSTCKTEKPYEEFHKDPSKRDGHRSQCADCANKYHKQFVVPTGRPTGRPRGSHSTVTDLQELLSLPKKIDKRNWKVEDARIALKAYIISRKDNVPYGDVLKKCKDFKKSLISSNALMQELRDAATAGMNLEEYFAKNRPFRKKSEVLGVGKKK